MCLDALFMTMKLLYGVLFFKAVTTYVHATLYHFNRSGIILWSIFFADLNSMSAFKELSEKMDLQEGPCIGNKIVDVTKLF